MPLYEYQCEACAHRFEQIQRFSDPPRTECPECGGRVRKLVSSPAIQFKGTGWYVTDYARQDKKGSGDGAETGESRAEQPGSADKDKKDTKGTKDTKPGDSKGSSDSPQKAVNTAKPASSS